MLKEYTISILHDNERRGYFVGESETASVDIPVPCWSGSSFQVAHEHVANLIFSENPENAKRMTRKNLMSYMNRILDQMPYWTVEIKAILIEEVKE